MPTTITSTPYLPVKEAFVNPSTGLLMDYSLPWFVTTAANVGALSTVINGVIGVNTATIATQPSVGAGDAGYILWLTDYKHLLRWTGAAWEFMDSAGNDYFKFSPRAPQTGLWQLCDGTATKYLTLGATLTETNFTVPDLVSTAAYLKSIAAYTGTINAKSGSTGTGTTGTGTTGTGTTGTDVTGTGSTGTPVSTVTVTVDVGTAVVVPVVHTHVENALSVPGLSVPGLSVPGLSVPALGVGSIEMANLGALVYYRR